MCEYSNIQKLLLQLQRLQSQCCGGASLALLILYYGIRRRVFVEVALPPSAYSNVNGSNPLLSDTQCYPFSAPAERVQVFSKVALYQSLVATSCY